MRTPGVRCSTVSVCDGNYINHNHHVITMFVLDYCYNNKDVTKKDTVQVTNYKHKLQMRRHTDKCRQDTHTGKMKKNAQKDANTARRRCPPIDAQSPRWL